MCSRTIIDLQAPMPQDQKGKSKGAYKTKGQSGARDHASDSLRATEPKAAEGSEPSLVSQSTRHVDAEGTEEVYNHSTTKRRTIRVRVVAY